MRSRIFFSWLELSIDQSRETAIASTFFLVNQIADSLFRFGLVQFGYDGALVVDPLRDAAVSSLTSRSGVGRSVMIGCLISSSVSPPQRP